MSAPSAREADRTARRSDALSWAVRAGLVGYAAVHLLVAWVALRLVWAGSGSGNATGKGALAQLAQQTGGRVVLFVMAVGFAALVVWQLVSAVVGYREQDGWRRQVLRFGALCRVVAYGYLAVVSAATALDGGSTGKSPNKSTSGLMSLPAGQWLVALIGLVAVGVGIGFAVFGWQKRFLRQLDEQARREEGRRVPIVVLGRIGYLIKGLAFVVMGLLLVWAAWTHDPHKSGGLDEALYELLGGLAGKVAIVVIAAGLACFGLFLLARAWHLERDALTGE